MDEDDTTSVGVVKATFGDDYDNVESDLIDIGYLGVTTVFDLPTLVMFAQSVRTFYETGYDDENFDWEVFNEVVWNLAGEMLLAAKSEGWGGKTIHDLLEYFELNA